MGVVSLLRTDAYTIGTGVVALEFLDFKTVGIPAGRQRPAIGFLRTPEDTTP